MNRTIEAPGVEIFEIDRSAYSRIVSGTRVMVTGFANQGMDYQPVTLTSKQAFLDYYGTPSNEAEKYFYAACCEVINRSGILHACKLPYDNESLDKFVYQDYELDPELYNVPTLDELSLDFDFVAGKIELNRDFNIAFKNAVIENIQMDSEHKIAINNINVKDGISIKNEIREILEDINIYSKDLSPDFTSYFAQESQGEIPSCELAHDDILDYIEEYCYETADTGKKFEWTNSSAGDDVKNAALVALMERDDSIRTYMKLKSVGKPTDALTYATVDLLETGEALPPNNHFWIVDKLRRTYSDSATRDDTGAKMNCIGIMPVITTAANAIYFQGLIAQNKAISKPYQTVIGANTLEDENNPSYELTDNDTAYPFANLDPQQDSISQQVSRNFPPIVFNSENSFDSEYLKSIGVVVLRAYVDPGAGNKINFDVVESFVGELDPKARNPRTKNSTFIGTIVNQYSNYIGFYSNCVVDKNTIKNYGEASFMFVEDQKAGMLGFYRTMAEKKISYKNSIDKGLDTVFKKYEDIHMTTVDLVVDGGISTIGQFIKTVYGENDAGDYDPCGDNASLFRLNTYSNDVWLSILRKYDLFCREIRRDCMFIADSPRSLCIRGSKKICRPTSPTTTIDNTIIPNLKFITGLNTSFGAGYCDWFQCVDDTSGDFFWCPPSIKAMGVYLNTDGTAAQWMAPAGMNRGRIADAIDLAFSPSIKQAGSIYTKGWNYAIQYSDAGIVLEGQKTLQQKQTAFDRINVRRLFLMIERWVYNTARKYVYEPNTASIRANLKSEVDKYLNGLLAKGAIYDFLTICDETINTPEVIDNSELRIKIGIKPTKAIEFILIQFYASRTGGSWDEIMYND